MKRLIPDDDSAGCPNCGLPMEAGVVVGRAPGVKFKPSRGLLGDLTGIPVTRGVFNHEADAFRCPGCGTVVIMPPD